jgi:RNA methyltransferase, TrmH family
LETITSRTNPTVRLVRLLLSRRSARYRERSFVAEGLRTVTTLVERGVELRAVLMDESRLHGLPDALTSTLSEGQEQRVVAVDHRLFRELSDVDEPQPILAVFRMPTLRMPENPDALLALDGVQDPGNLGSVLRSAAAAGVEGVLLLPGTVDRFSPKVVRSTAGLIGSLPVMAGSEAESYFRELAGKGLQIVLADGDGAIVYTDYDWSAQFLLVVGSEASGASPTIRDAVNETVRIPMSNGVESINVAAASAVLLFEAQRQRQNT